MRRNIVIVVADDAAYSHFGFTGNGNARTPKLDELALSATVLNNMYAHPVCTTSRCSLLGGVYPHRYGMADGVIRPWTTDVAFPSGIPMIQERLKSAGYKTFCFGKWHLGHGKFSHLPTQRGFDVFKGCFGGATDYWSHNWQGEPDWHDGNQSLGEDGYATDLIGRHAANAITGHDFKTPMFLYIPFTAPHHPLQARPEDIERFGHVEEEDDKTYFAMLYAMDRQIGKIVDALKDQSQWDNTLFLFVSDNGGENKWGNLDSISNGGLRGYKRSLYEGGIKSPALFWSSDTRHIRNSDSLLHLIDVPVLCANEAGVSSAGLDGRDLIKILRKQEQRDQLLLHYDSVSYALWRKGIKYIKNPLRDYASPETHVMAFSQNDVNENCNIGHWAETGFIPGFEKEMQQQASKSILPNESVKPANFSPFPNWTPPG